jgi:MoxR-like ATPase
VTAAAPAPAFGSETADLRAEAAALSRACAELRAQVARRIVGMDDVVEQALLAILCRGHALLEGVPGLGKTLLVSTIASLLDLTFSRIQFTPDLMPSDVTGSEFLTQDAQGARAYRFAKGPVFANVLLADEVNRTPPKTQAALMEAMEERQVTSLGVRRPLDPPFFVLATQNPIEQQGTYPLPAAQLDRFLFKIGITYPSVEDEARIVRRTTAGTPPDLVPVLSRERLLSFFDVVDRTPVPESLRRYAVALVRASRPGDPSAPPVVREYVAWGVGPRAAQGLVQGAKARALVNGRSEPGVEDVRALVPAVFRHRLILSYAAEADVLTPDDVARALLDHVEAPGGPEEAPRASWWRRAYDFVAGRPRPRRVALEPLPR